MLGNRALQTDCTNSHTSELPGSAWPELEYVYMSNPDSAALMQRRVQTGLETGYATARVCEGNLLCVHVSFLLCARSPGSTMSAALI